MRRDPASNSVEEGACRHEGSLALLFGVLGASEGIGTFSHLVATIEKKYKLYAKNVTAARPHIEFPVGSFAGKYTNRGIGKGASAPTESGQTAMEIQKEADGVVLSQYAPADVVIHIDITCDKIAEEAFRTSEKLAAAGVSRLSLAIKLIIRWSL